MQLLLLILEHDTHPHTMTGSSHNNSSTLTMSLRVCVRTQIRLQFDSSVRTHRVRAATRHRSAPVPRAFGRSESGEIVLRTALRSDFTPQLARRAHQCASAVRCRLAS